MLKYLILFAAFFLFVAGAAEALCAQDKTDAAAGNSHMTKTKTRKPMAAKGKFEVKVVPQQDKEAPAGRMVLDKKYLGGLKGVGLGQMISKRIDGGAAVYFAIEEFSGTVDGKTGTFTLLHKGFMDTESQTLEIEIMEGSGTGDLKSISGSMVISQDENGHTYELKYDL